MTEPMLGLLGIDPDAERLYRLLVRSGVATVAQLAEELGEDPNPVAASAAQLRAAGLVAALAGGDSTFAPVDPRVALRSLADRHSEQLDRVRAQVPVLAELFESARHRGTGNGATVVLADPDAVAATYVRVQHQARDQFLAFDRPPYVSASENPLQPVVLDRGVSWRAVYAAASFEIPGAWDEAQALAGKGEQARVVADLPVKLAIADHDLALVSLQLDPLRVEALRTESRPMVEALCALFEYFWERGSPVAAAGSAAAAVAAART
ncbi:TrmB family transcriptional regulator, partial [Jatrophihabitans sp. YIM 134969]